MEAKLSVEMEAKFSEGMGAKLSGEMEAKQIDGS
jgi:hypothetical protein